MPKTSPPKDSADVSAAPSFEAAMEELERIVAGMESSDLSLEASLAAHKRGLELAKYCQELLSQAQQQVTVLEEHMLRNLGDPSRNDAQ